MNQSHGEATPVNKKWIVPGVILVIILPFLCLLPYPMFLGFDMTAPGILNTTFIITRALFWLLLAGFIFYARKVERSKLLLWDEKQYSFGIYVTFSLITFLAVILSMITVGLIMRILHLEFENVALEKINRVFKGNYLLIVLTCVTAGVTEELLFRGYLQPRLELLFRNRAIGIIGSAFFFGLLHFGFGTVQNIIGPFVIGIIFAIHYSYFRNIRFLVMFHILWDLLALFAVLNYPGR